MAKARPGRPTPEEQLLNLIEKGGGDPGAVKFKQRRRFSLAPILNKLEFSVRAGLAAILGKTDRSNVHGETLTRLDWFAQQMIYRAMNHGGHLCVMASEESDDIINIPSQHPKAFKNSRRPCCMGYSKSFDGAAPFAIF